MSPLGLTAAVQGGINASRLRTADDNAAADRQHMLKRRGLEDQALDAQTAANEAASAVISQAAEAHKASGATTPYRPGPLDAVRALDARSAAFVQAKDFRGFMENEGTAASARLRARQQFLQEFQSTGDFGTFVKNAYATLPNGDEVENVEIVKGGAADGPKGAPTGPDMARITLKSGRTVMADPKNVVAQITQSLRDPVKAAEQEAEMHFKALLKRQEVAAETEGKIKVEKVKGEEDRTTKGIEHNNALGLAAVNNKSRERTAGISADATRYSADQGLVGRKYAADRSDTKGADENGRELSHKVDWTKAARESYGPSVNGPMGGSRISDSRMVGLAKAAREIYEANPTINKETALLEAAKALGIKSPAAFGGDTN